MSSVLTVQAVLSGDASGLVGAAGLASAAIAKVKDIADKVQSGGSAAFDKLASNVGTAIGKTIKVMTDLSVGVVDVTANVIKSLAGMTIKATLAGAALATVFGGSAIKAGLDRLMSIQDATVALTRMLGSAEAAAELTGKALKVVQGTPFAFPQFAEATRTLVAFGVGANKVPDILQAIADSAAASGRGAEAVNGLTQAFANLKVTGKMSSDIIQSLGTSGVNALGILANHFGVTTGEAQNMVSDGLIPADDAMQILVDGIEKGSHGIAGDFNSLAGAAQDLGKTVSGSLGNVKAAFARMGATWLKPFEKDFPDVMNKGVIPLLDKVGEAGQKMTTRLADTGVLTRVTDAFISLTDNVVPFIDTIGGVIKMLSPLQIGFEAIKPYLPRMKEDFAGIGKLIQTDVIPALGQLIGALMPILPALTDLVGSGIKGFIEVLPTMVSLIGGLTDIIIPLIGIISDLPGPVLGVVVALGALQAMGVPIGGIMRGIGTALMTAAGVATTAGTTMGAASTLALGPWGVALALLAVPLGIFMMHQQEVKQTIENFTASLDTQTGALTKNTKALAVNVLEGKGAYEAAATLGITRDILTNATMGEADALAFVNRKLAENKTHAENSTFGTDKLTMAYYNVMGSIGSTTRELEGAKTADEEHAQAMGLVSDALAVHKDRWLEAKDAITANGISLDNTTIAGQNNLTALQNLGDASVSLTDAMQKEGRTHAEIDNAVAANRAQFMELARKMGASEEQARTLADQMIKLPNIERTVTVNTGAAMANIATLTARLNAIQSRSVMVDLNGSVSGSGRMGTMAVGGIMDTVKHASGAIHAASGRISQMAKGGANILWAEPETGWEAYISGNDRNKQRNEDIWVEAGDRLGMFDQQGSGGGISITNNNYAAPGMSVDEMGAKVSNLTRFTLEG